MTRDLSSHDCVLLRNRSWGNDTTIYLIMTNHSWRNDYDQEYFICAIYYPDQPILIRRLTFHRTTPSGKYRSNACSLLRSSIYIRFLHGNIRQKQTKRLRTNILTYLIIFKFTQTKTLFYIDLLLRIFVLDYLFQQHK